LLIKRNDLSLEAYIYRETVQFTWLGNPLSSAVSFHDILRCWTGTCWSNPI